MNLFSWELLQAKAGSSKKFIARGRGWWTRRKFWKKAETLRFEEAWPIAVSVRSKPNVLGESAKRRLLVAGAARGTPGLLAGSARLFGQYMAGHMAMLAEFAGVKVPHYNIDRGRNSPLRGGVEDLSEHGSIAPSPPPGPRLLCRMRGGIIQPRYIPARGVPKTSATILQSFSLRAGRGGGRERDRARGSPPRGGVEDLSLHVELLGPA